MKNKEFKEILSFSNNGHIRALDLKEIKIDL